MRLIQGGEERDLVTLLKARPAAPGSEAAEPGEIVENGTVACAGGTRFDVLDIQSRGRKPMSLTSYRNGKPWTAGMRLAAVIPAHS